MQPGNNSIHSAQFQVLWEASCDAFFPTPCQSHSRRALWGGPEQCCKAISSPVACPVPNLKETEWRTAGGLIHGLYQLSPQPEMSAKTTCTTHTVHSGKVSEAKDGVKRGAKEAAG